MSWYRKSPLTLAIVLFVHITLLDLFYITLNGPVFLWEENLQLVTILAHVVIVAVSVLFYLLVSKSRIIYSQKKFKVPEQAWLICSIGLFASIIFLVL